MIEAGQIDGMDKLVADCLKRRAAVVGENHGSPATIDFKTLLIDTVSFTDVLLEVPDTAEIRGFLESRFERPQVLEFIQRYLPGYVKSQNIEAPAEFMLHAQARGSEVVPGGDSVFSKLAIRGKNLIRGVLLNPGRRVFGSYGGFHVSRVNVWPCYDKETGKVGGISITRLLQEEGIDHLAIGQLEPNPPNPNIADALNLKRIGVFDLRQAANSSIASSPIQIGSTLWSDHQYGEAFDYLVIHPPKAA